jgi:arginase
VTDLEGRAPLVRDEDVVHVGRRDADEAERAGSQRIEETPITVFDLASLRQRGPESIAHDALARLVRRDLDGIWVHLDCDALDDAVMPAVDYRLPDGLRWHELEAVLGAAIASGAVAGIEVTIFNPALDPDGSIARDLVACLTRALAGGLSRRRARP